MPSAPDSVRRLALLVSTMRSGSTLLKALLGEAPDISRLPEINFQKFNGTQRWDDVWALAPQPIVLLKKPAWYHEARWYPRLPQAPQRKVILLVRDVVPTVESLRRMTFGYAAAAAGPLVDRWLTIRYWLPVTRRLVQLQTELGMEARLVRYEDLVQRPVEVTRQLFEFLGSARVEGTDTYREPQSGRWRWGLDDNSHQIRSLRVQPSRPRAPASSRLERLIRQTPLIEELRRQLGYV